MSPEVSQRVRAHLGALYPDDDLDGLTNRVLGAIGSVEPMAPSAVLTRVEHWTAADTLLITYGDSIVDDGRAPLAVLLEVIEQLDDAVSAVHLLPFHPYSSDRGFSVIDPAQVDPVLGTWEDIDKLSDAVDLMTDVVCNHVSTDSIWFRQFIADTEPGRSFFVTAHEDADVSLVVRPRSAPLLQRFDTATGPRWVWCTFGRDQADLDYTNPDVLVEMTRIIARYLDHGARFLRLDAIAYLWKEAETSCVHLPQTHEVVKLWHTLTESRAGSAALITETNVPDAENRSYFGAGDEAQVIYNFSLPPLVIDAVLHERADRLGSWLASAPPPPDGCTFLNFLASHDGIGLRPAEGLLSPADIDSLVATAAQRGGRVGTYDSPVGPRPYEIAISLWDLLSNPQYRAGDPLAVARFVCAHTIMAGIAGIPAIYVNALFAEGNDLETPAMSGVARDISRARLGLTTVLERLHQDPTPAGRATRSLIDMLRVRRSLRGFNPDATQEILASDGPVLAFVRATARDRIVAVHNCSASEVIVPLAAIGLSDVAGRRWDDALSGRHVNLEGIFQLQPYESLWLTER